jgi:predicted DCC family thiol-disulfide oxidoreductase YuxK
MSVRERLEQHWFAPARVRDLAYLRIALVGVLLAGSMWPGALDHQLRLTLLPAAWFEALPALKVLTAPLVWGWGVRPSALLVTSMWMLCGAAGLFALVGARTRLSLALFAYANTFLIAHAFSYGTLQHPQAPATIILFVLLLTPCGEALSVDSMRKRVAESRRRGKFIPRADEATSANARWPLRLAQWLLVAAYLSAGVSKLVVGKGAWMNGYTMGYYLLLDGFGHQLPLSVAIAHVHWLGVVSAVVTMTFELTFVVSVLWPRTFPVYGAVGTGLHTGIFLLMRAPFFQFVAMYAAWGEALRDARLAIFARAERRVWTIVYDGYCPLCIRTMTQLDELDGERRLRFVDLERELGRVQELVPGVSIEELREEMVVVTPDGRALRGFFAIRELSKRLAVLWVLVPVMYAPGAEWVGPRVYAWVAERRARRAAANSVIDFGGSAS